jgi:hypothetical protein
MPFLAPNILSKPSVSLSYDPPTPDGIYEISSECVMPSIVVTASISDDYNLPGGVFQARPRFPEQTLGIDARIKAAVSAHADFPQCRDYGSAVTFYWNVTLRFDGKDCPYAVGRGANTQHPPITAVTTSNRFKIPFELVEGGDLTVSVLATGPGLHVTATGHLTVVGRNPTRGELANFQPPVALIFRRLLNQETGGKQFVQDRTARPVFNQNNDGGVGICQVTPPANDEQVWSWKANLRAGLAIWDDKRRLSDFYYRQVRNDREPVVNTNLNRFATFTEMVNAYNEARRRLNPSAHPLSVRLPPLSADQSEMDTIRGFNGWAKGLHEFQVRVDENGLLWVNVDPDGRSGSAEWEQVSQTAREAYYGRPPVLPRRKWGETNYVARVQRIAPAW